MGKELLVTNSSQKTSQIKWKMLAKTTNVHRNELVLQIPSLVWYWLFAGEATPTYGYFHKETCKLPNR